MTDFNAAEWLANYRLPDPLGFGVEIAPLMYRADFADGQWRPGSLLPFQEIGINPAATAVQFAQQCFEGMKAYRVDQPRAQLFRPDRNHRRLCSSARRLCMPELPAGVFADALSSLCGEFESFIPGATGQSLYLRPTLIGTGPTFAVKSSDTFTFVLVASPSDAYYAQPIRVMVERNDCRAALGGTGADKVGGNYAASLQATVRCMELGFDQPLWLDPASRRNIEELSGMNFMAVIDGEIHTPSLSGSILPGVTRDSLLTLARQSGMSVIERDMPVDEVLDDIRDGRCSEAFSCGTAAIVGPISAIGESDGSALDLPQVNQVAATLRRQLLDIQEGRAPDERGWMADAVDREALVHFLN